MSRNSSRKVKKFKKKRKASLIRGKANLGFLLVILLIIFLGASLGFGQLKAGFPEPSPYYGYLCCDSGDGEKCTTNPSLTLVARVKGVVTEYQLLKTQTRLTEGAYHLSPIDPNDIISGVKPGEFVYVNAASEEIWDKAPWFYNETCGEIHGGIKLNPMDTIFKKNFKKYGLDPKEVCLAIPDDELIYVCTKGCDANPDKGDDGIFNAYFRTRDLPIPGIPDAIKNCDKPTWEEIQEFEQRIINLPSPSIKPDLQFETFYVENEVPVSNWLSPFCKPAVYLYPEKTSHVSVRVQPAGKMLLTIPQYPLDGWSVTAKPNGDIFIGNTKFDYLFYEAAIADESIILPDKGFVREYNSLSKFLPALVRTLGLNVKETEQFSEYWLKVLPLASYYQIKIIDQSILGRLSPIYLIPAPQTSIRVTLHFTPLEQKVDLKEPELVTPLRRGFTMVEWGGIYKRDSDHPFSCLM